MEKYLVFESDIFFYFLLPIIIFNTGYNMQDVLFFQNIGSIIIIAFLSTFLSAFLIAIMLFIVTYSRYFISFSFLNCFIFGSIISATDTISVLTLFRTLGVDETLYALVFGESMFNDAVAMVLYKSLLTFQYVNFTFKSLIYALYTFISVFIGSLCCGVIVGCLASLLLKYTNLYDKKNKDLERAVLIIVPFICYMFAEGLTMSGIVAMLFCGIVMSKYTEYNMSNTTYLFYI